MPRGPLVTLDGYSVALVREKAVCLVDADMKQEWVPRFACDQGDELSVGDTDIVISKSMADEKGLNY